MMKNIYLQILDKQPDFTPLALATITGTKGSTPQKPGSSALFGAAGLLSGTVGGGILEAKVQEIAQRAILSKKSGLYHFKLDNDISQQEEAICGGRINILVDASISDHLSVFRKAKKSVEDRIPGVMITRVTRSGKGEVSIHRSWVTRDEKQEFPSDHLIHLERGIKSILSDGIPWDYREIKLSDEQREIQYFMEPVFPLPQLVIAGAGHIGKALAHLGSLLEFEVMVIDERAYYANRENIPDADHIVVDDIGRAVQKLKKTAATYIVIVTRGHKNDADALRSCIGSGASYVGMIGSKKKVALMRKNFLEEGLATPEQWESVYSPIGLDIHSKTVQEIAVSIAAQLIGIRNSKMNSYA
jgi:xanthine dehydrogenase accessory factor